MGNLTSVPPAGQIQKNPTLQPIVHLSGFICMMKKCSAAALLGLLLLAGGCATHFTNLTPQHQERNANNLYPVEVALDSRQQTLRWQTIQPQIVVGTEFYSMRPTKMMANRWEGLVPVPAGTNLIHYRYKFDFNYNAMGAPKSDSALSGEYTLRILDKP